MAESKLIHGFIVERAEGLTDEQRENNRRWVEALRSGTYTQTTSCLHNQSGYCCLGVAAETAGAGWKLGDPDSGRQWPIFGGEELSPTTLDMPIREVFGLLDSHGFKVRAEGESKSHSFGLPYLNDDIGFSFAKIADVIEFWAGLEEGPSVIKEAASGTGVEDDGGQG